MAIEPDDDFGSLYQKLAWLGAELLVKTIRAIEAGIAPSVPQVIPEGELLKPAPKIFRETGQINWHRPAEEIHNLVRGLSPIPAAWFTADGTGYKVFHSQVVHFEPGESPLPGTIESDGKTELKIAAADGHVSLLEIQPEGKKRLVISDFLKGNSIAYVD
jgi:methionyl-tRNA formyltransferase